MVKASTPQEVIGLRLDDYVHPDDLESSRQRGETILQQGVQVPCVTSALGPLTAITLILKPATGPCVHKGEPAIQIIARDVSERDAPGRGGAKTSLFREAIISTAAEGLPRRFT